MHGPTNIKAIKRIRHSNSRQHLRPYLEIQYLFKGKVVPVHTMKAYRGARRLPQHLPNLGTRWRLVVNFTSRLTYPLPEKELPVISG